MNSRRWRAPHLTTCCNSSNQMLESSGSSNQMMESGPGQARGDGWMVPRKWMLPSMANTDFAKQLDLFQTKDSEVIRVKDEPDKFEVSLDTSQYRPDELSVNVADGVVSIEGKHEEKSEDGRKMVSRQFSRKYTLPQGAKAENVVSNLSSDGVLVVCAPRREAIAN